MTAALTADGAKGDRNVPLEGVEAAIHPKTEWRQIFADAWRIERDFFYDPALHGVDWTAMKDRYGRLIDACTTRNDVNIVLGELLGEAAETSKKHHANQWVTSAVITEWNRTPTGSPTSQ